MFYSCWLVKANEISILKRYINDQDLPKGNLEKQPNVSKCASSFVGFKLKELTLKDSYGTLLGLVTVPARETHTPYTIVEAFAVGSHAAVCFVFFFNQAKFEFFERHSWSLFNLFFPS